MTTSSQFSLCFCFLISLFSGIAFAQSSPKPAAAAPATDPAQVVAATQGALNRHDVDGMMAYFAPIVPIVHVMEKRFTESVSAEDWRKRFTFLFTKMPDFNWALLSRVVNGPYVSDYYKTLEGGKAGTTMYVYEVQGGKIVNLWHFDANHLVGSKHSH